MKRLTKKVHGVWTALCKYESSPFPVVTQEIIDRLAAYEDTALTPEEVQAMRWIPVEERLPDNAKEVIVILDNGYITVSWRSCDNSWYISDTRKVTHWMPLPEPPKEGKP